MKRWLCCLLPVLFLCGCGAEETVETVADEWLLPAMAQPREIAVQLPDNLAAPAMEQTGRRMYLAEAYEIILETMESGDLDATVRSLTGYERDRLTVICTEQDAADRYDFVWTAAGEMGDRLGRGTILDDGNYHYCLSVLRDGTESVINWQDVFRSFSLV